jgi:hypothetical protein
MTFRERVKPKPGSCRNAHCTNTTKNGGYCNTCAKRKQRLSDPVRYYWENLKCSANKRKIPFDLTVEEFRGWVVEAGFQITGNNKFAEGDTVDRINDDPRRGYNGYRIGNIQKLTLGANASKFLSYDWRTKTCHIVRFQPLSEEDDLPF